MRPMSTVRMRSVLVLQSLFLSVVELPLRMSLDWLSGTGEISLWHLVSVVMIGAIH